MKILYLYSELMGYQIPILEEYVNNYNAEVHVFHWDNKKLTPYMPPVIRNVFYYRRSEYSRFKILKFVRELKPDIIYISGWMDIGYLYVVRKIKKEGVPIIAGSDGVFNGSFKQRLATVIFPLIKNILFTKMWVAGSYQYEYAKRLGFENSEILFDCYSADIYSFNEAFEANVENKKEEYPHSFLYVGRFEEVKGIDLLIEAWNNICENNKNKDWDLCLIGSGTLNDDFVINTHVKVLDFMTPEELVQEIGKFGCFVLPSRYEPWALVIHEFACAGLPIVCSDVCGASSVFVLPGFNGFKFVSEEVKALEDKLLKIINTCDTELVLMSNNSNIIGQKISPQITAATFMSVLH
jgi:glycosyltransferase involved in cell wall biosynthesis